MYYEVDGAHSRAGSVDFLVDSGSSHTFLSVRFVNSLSAVQSLDKAMLVQVANGGLLHCSANIPAAQWFVGDYSFTTDLKILPLQHFDMILGMEWLELHSPMKVHWKHKWMAVPYKGSTTFIQGIVPHLSEELLVHVCSVNEVDIVPDGEVHPEIEVLLHDFVVVF